MAALCAIAAKRVEDGAEWEFDDVPIANRITLSSH
jgi:hypothetical protein